MSKNVTVPECVEQQQLNETVGKLLDLLMGWVWMGWVT